MEISGITDNLLNTGGPMQNAWSNKRNLLSKPTGITEGLPDLSSMVKPAAITYESLQAKQAMGNRNVISYDSLQKDQAAQILQPRTDVISYDSLKQDQAKGNNNVISYESLQKEQAAQQLIPRTDVISYDSIKKDQAANNNVISYDALRDAQEKQRLKTIAGLPLEGITALPQKI